MASKSKKKTSRPVSSIDKGRKSNRKTSPIYFLSLKVKNLRCFGPEQTLDLTGKSGGPARWTVILGDNGTGKTTLLEALALLQPIPDQHSTAEGEKRIIPRGFPENAKTFDRGFIRAGPAEFTNIVGELAHSAQLDVKSDESINLVLGIQINRFIWLYFNLSRISTRLRKERNALSHGGFPKMRRHLIGDLLGPVRPNLQISSANLPTQHNWM